jgi:ABC-type uncharacterized transport system permease subunit
VLIDIITGLSYLVLAVFFVLRINHPAKEVPEWGKWLPLAPIALHLYALYLAIETDAGQNLSLLNTLSLIALIMVLLIAIYRFNHQTPHLMLYASLFAGLVSLLNVLPEKPNILMFKDNALGFWHVWLSVIGFSLLLVATLQSIFVLLLHKKLRSRPASIHPLMPPLMQMEQFLSALVLSGIISLGIAIVLGFMQPDTALKAQSLHKIILSAIAWFSFCTFYLGYKLSRLSGIRFARLCIIAFIILAIGFIGSKLVLDYILQRG